MTQLRSSLRLAQKARADVRPEGQLGREQLDRHIALQAFVPGEIDDTHPPAPDLTVYFIVRFKNGSDVRPKGIVRS